MKSRHGGWVLLAAFVVVLAVGTYTGSNLTTGEAVKWEDLVWAWSFTGFPATGALIVSRYPRRPLGWIFCAGPLSLMTGVLISDITLGMGDRGDVSQWGAWAAGILFSVGLGILLLIPFFLPNGSLGSGAIRIAFRIVIACQAVWFATATFAPGPLEEFPDYINPIGIEALGAIFEFFKNTLGFVLFASLGAGIISIVVRFRRAAGQERLQTKWIALGATAVPLVFATITVIELFVDLTDVQVTLFIVLAILAVPMSVGVAMLKHRLFEVDQVINRTLVYAVLTASLVACYLGLVFGLQFMVDSFTNDSDLAVAASTLTVAALFRPLRSRVQNFIDRRFYRRKYNATTALDSFALRLRDEVDLGVVQGNVLDLLGQTIQPSHASLWLKAERSG